MANFYKVVLEQWVNNDRKTLKTNKQNFNNAKKASIAFDNFTRKIQEQYNKINIKPSLWRRVLIFFRIKEKVHLDYSISMVKCRSKRDPGFPIKTQSSKN